MAAYPLGERREALCAWLTANGIDPKNVPQDADMTITTTPTGRALRCEVFDRDDNGHIHLDDRGQKPAITVVTVSLTTEPPEWWAPYEKPTRDHFLDVTEKLRRLAEAGPPSGMAVAGEWENGWNAAMEAVTKLLPAEEGA